MTKIARSGLIVLYFLLVAACATDPTAPQPDWVLTGESVEYPMPDYITGVGCKGSVPAAQQAAAEAITKKLLERFPGQAVDGLSYTASLLLPAVYFPDKNWRTRHGVCVFGVLPRDQSLRMLAHDIQGLQFKIAQTHAGAGGRSALEDLHQALALYVLESSRQTLEVLRNALSDTQGQTKAPDTVESSLTDRLYDLLSYQSAVSRVGGTPGLGSTGRLTAAIDTAFVANSFRPTKHPTFTVEALLLDTLSDRNTFEYQITLKFIDNKTGVVAIKTQCFGHTKRTGETGAAQAQERAAFDTCTQKFLTKILAPGALAGD